MIEKKIKTFVIGHKNPDIDSLVGAYALAELRRRQNPKEEFIALSAGIVPERGKYLFNKFNQTLPQSRNDIYIQIQDIMHKNPQVILEGTSLFDAVKTLGEAEQLRLPVVSKDNKLIGMLSAQNLLSWLFNIGNDAGQGLTGRQIYSSINLINKVINGEVLTAFNAEENRTFEVYVAAMRLESFEQHLPKNNPSLAVIVGDRSEIHMRALNTNIKLLIITGKRDVEPLILQEAARQNITIIKTSLDSASVIRRLKFSIPVEHSEFQELSLKLSPTARLKEWRKRIINNSDDNFPVLSEKGKLLGIVSKCDVSDTPPFRVILVDHNEIEQCLAGVEELPIIEVVDHHRIGITPTNVPIKYTADTVGSSCTLIAMMYRNSGESLTSELAGLLLGGIVSDTLNLLSPTTANLDRQMYNWLEKISKISGDSLMNELQSIDSPLTSKDAKEVIISDCKNYNYNELSFSLSQVEESNLELLHHRKDELLDELAKEREQEKLNLFALLVTDAVRGNSELLISCNEELLSLLPYEKIDDNLFALPGILSRKKQLLPQIINVLSEYLQNI